MGTKVTDIWGHEKKMDFIFIDPVKLAQHMLLETKRNNWREEIKPHEEFIQWFERNEPYINSLEYDAYYEAAERSRATIKKLRNKIRYARR